MDDGGRGRMGERWSHKFKRVAQNEIPNFGRWTLNTRSSYPATVGLSLRGGIASELHNIFATLYLPLPSLRPLRLVVRL